MKKTGMSGVSCILCVLLLLYELSSILHTGPGIMFPVMAYGSGSRAAVLEQVTMEQSRRFLPIFFYGPTDRIQEKRKDVFLIKSLDKEEMLTLMELENANEDYLSLEQLLLKDTSQSVINVSEENRSEETGSQEGSRESSQVDTQNGFQGSMSEDEQNNFQGNMPDTFTGDTQNGGQSDSQNNAQKGSQGLPNTFIKHEKLSNIELSELADYETLVKRFYTIDAITTIGADELNAKKLGSMDMTLKQTPDKPQILIYHTHSQEAYVDSVPGDDSTNIMGVGEHLKEILEQEYGYNVIHHMGKYDVKTRDNAYSQSLPEIKQLLEEHPSIEVVIDLHRDGVADESIRLVTDMDGRPTAKFMFFNGISRTKTTGKINYLKNENLQENLAFSFQMKWKAEEYYPGLTRRNYLNAYRYNMHLCPKTLLLELGAQTNTLEEAMNACDPIAHILHMVLSGEG